MPDSTTAKFFARNRVCEMPKYDGWLHMSYSIEFALFFRFRSEYNGLLLTGEANFFLAKPNLSLLRMHDFISCEIFRISPRKSAREIRPLHFTFYS